MHSHHYGHSSDRTRSFRDALAHGISPTMHTYIPVQPAKHDDSLASFHRISKLSLESLCMPQLQRDASIHSTPEPSDCFSQWQSQFDSSPFGMTSDDEDDSWQHIASSDTIVDLTALPLPPLDLCSHAREVDYEVDYAEELAAEEALAATEESKMEGRRAGSPVDVTFVVRRRHHNQLMLGLPSQRVDRWRNSPHDHSSYRSVVYFAPSKKSGTGVAHLRKGLLANKRSNANSAAAEAADPAPAADKPFSVSNPYDGESLAKKGKKKKAHDAAGADELFSSALDLDGKRANAQADRAAIHLQRQSLASTTRPAIQSAAPSFRAVLQARAVRKLQLVQAAAAASERPAKHLRICSVKGKVPVCGKKKPSKGPGLQRKTYAAAPAHVLSHFCAEHNMQPRDDISVADATSFSDFRRRFFLKNRELLERALDPPGFSYYQQRVVAIRHAPTGDAVRSRFMHRLRALGGSAVQEEDIPLVFHGTCVHNMDSICSRGLLVPNPAVNGVGVANGSAMGVGIYTSRDANYSVGYASATSCTIFACAALTTGAHHYDCSMASSGPGSNRPDVVQSGSVVVLNREDRVLPLFLIDFENTAPQWRHTVGNKDEDEMPSIAMDLLRALLKHANQRLRYDTRRAGLLLKSAPLCAD
jgi:hypothetical protein